MGVHEFRQSKDEYLRWTDEICRENRRALRLLWRALIPLGVANMFAQAVIAGPVVSVAQRALILCYGGLLALAEHFLLPRETRHATALLHLACAPVFLLAVLLGTVWDPVHEATTILLVLVVLPIFTLDRLPRMAGVMGLWLALFIVLSRAMKPEEIFYVDLLHGVEFYCAALIVYALTTQVRMKYLRNLETVAYERDHDRELGCLNRKALLARLGGCAGRPLVLLVAGLEQERLYRDYFGSTMADALLKFFAETLCSVFGGEAVAATASREVDYEGSEVDMIIYVNDIPQYEKGVYSVDVYSASGLLGTTELLLR